MIYIFNEIPIKVSACFFGRNLQAGSKMYVQGGTFKMADE